MKMWDNLRLIWKQIQRDRSANDFLHVGANDGQFHHNPENPSGPLCVIMVSDFGGVLTRNNTQASAQSLKKQTQNVSYQKDPD